MAHDPVGHAAPDQPTDPAKTVLAITIRVGCTEAWSIIACAALSWRRCRVST